ncbi:MAG: hypothetical protein JSR85_04335 [Proteobacteria bacterium]|nr:hypothetical protein [Pseudomonadota bacterium]
MNKSFEQKIKIFVLSAVVLAGLEAGSRADSCFLNCVDTLDYDVRSCKEFYLKHPNTTKDTEECIARSNTKYKNCIKECTIQ